MLSILNIPVGQATSGYYRQEGYYTKDGDEFKEASQWFGKGAEAAGLSGYVDPKTFDEVMKGISPDGEQMDRKNTEGKIEYRPGLCLTFAVTKSSSILALIGGDERIVQAHDKAVQVALAYVEEKFLNTRVRTAENVEQEVLGGQKMLAAVFRHDISKSLNPQLHSHAVIAKMCMGTDGKWRSVENPEIYLHSFEVGAVYRCAYAHELFKMGIPFKRVGRLGFFKHGSVPQDLSNSMSTGSAEVKRALEDSKYPVSASVSARAALVTHNAEGQNVDREALYQLWRDEAASMGLDTKAFEAIKKGSSGPVIISDEDRRIDAETAVSYAVAYVSERYPAYECSELRVAAFSATKQATHQDVNAAIERKIETGDLIRVVAKGLTDHLTAKGVDPVGDATDPITAGGSTNFEAVARLIG